MKVPTMDVTTLKNRLPDIFSYPYPVLSFRFIFFSYIFINSLSFTCSVDQEEIKTSMTALIDQVILSNQSFFAQEPDLFPRQALLLHCR
jgi:hypothetical protein